MKSNTSVRSHSNGLLEIIEDYKQLVKFRLNLFVVFSAVASFLIVSGWSVSWEATLLLSLGGFLITGAANALNEVLEKDYDKMMQRTADRPLAAGRMSVSEAVMAAGIMFVLGIFILTLFNPLSAVLGSFAVISYAFIYTPMKRFSTAAVAVGALPGALPVLIGAVAYQGEITLLAFTIFAIQFIWQFPHFWAIGWLGFNDYNKAGFKLVQSINGEPDPKLGAHAAVYTLMLIPFLGYATFLSVLTIPSLILLVIITLVYSWFGYRLFKNPGTKSARDLMFSSFFYLPFSLFILLIFN